MADLSVKLGPLTLPNPVIAASGTFGYGLEYEQLVDLDGLGGIVVKGLSPKPIPGNPPPRIVETASGMLNSIGLANIGVDAFLNDKLPRLKEFPNLHIFANIYGHSPDEYVQVARRLAQAQGLAGIEINLSCPNVDQGGLVFGTDPALVESLTRSVRDIYPGFLMVKLTPNVTDVTQIARAAQDGGADGLSLINTLTGMAVDLESRRPVLGGVTGGLSGPAIRPVALHMVHRVVRAVDLPVIGMGGIMTGADALAFLLVGARAVQVGTANFASPRSCVEIPAQISAWLDEHAIARVEDFIGTLHLEN